MGNLLARMMVTVLVVGVMLLGVPPSKAATQFAGGTYVYTSFVGSSRQVIISNIEDNLVTAGWTSIAGLFSGTYTSGGSVTGSAGQTCTLSAFNNGNTGGTATVALTGTNTIAGGTALTITAIGTGSTSAATSATLSSGSATCSGTATISTVISKSHTANILVRSAIAQSLYQVDIRLMDNSATGAQLYLENTAFTLKPAAYSSDRGATLIPTGSPTYYIVASRYQAVVYSTASTTSRQFAWFGIPYVASFQTASLTNVGFLFSDAAGDGDGTARTSLRQAPSVSSSRFGSPNFELMSNADWWEAVANAGIQTNNYTGAPRLLLASVVSDLNYTTPASSSYRWFGVDAIMTGDVYLGWGATTYTDEAKVIGQVYDAVYIADAVTINTTSTFASHTWVNLTDNQTGSAGQQPRGGIWMATN